MPVPSQPLRERELVMEVLKSVYRHNEANQETYDVHKVFASLGYKLFVFHSGDDYFNATWTLKLFRALGLTNLKKVRDVTKHTHFRQLLRDMAEAMDVSQDVLIKQAVYDKSLQCILSTPQNVVDNVVLVDCKDRECTMMHKDLGMMFVQLICPSLGLAYANVLNRYFSGQVTTEESRQAQQTMETISVQVDETNARLQEELVVKEEQLEQSAQQLAYKEDEIKQLKETLEVYQSTQLTKLNWSETSIHLKRHHIQCSLQAIAICLVEMEENKFMSLVQFLKDCWNVDVKNAHKLLRVIKRQENYLTIKMIIQKIVKFIGHVESSSDIEGGLLYTLLKSFEVWMLNHSMDHLKLTNLASTLYQLEKGNSQFNLEAFTIELKERYLTNKEF